MPTDRPLNRFPTLTPPGGLPKITSIMKDFSAESLAELRLWLEQNPPATPVTSIIGFSQFTAQAASVATTQTTTSSTFGDLAGPGPTITGLSDGKYLLVWGATASEAGAGVSAKMAISVNSGAASSSVALTQTSTLGGIVRADLFTLAGGGNNTVKAVYASSDNVSVATFSERWLVAIRYANK